MSKWRVTIERSPVQHKVIKVTGPATAKLAEAAALQAMKWEAKDCLSVEAEPYESDAPAPVTVIEVVPPKPSDQASIDDMEDSTPPKPARKKRAAKKR